MTEERYEDCAECDQRFSGEDNIASYLREFNIPGGTKFVCIDCMRKKAKKERPAPTNIRMLFREFAEELNPDPGTCPVCPLGENLRLSLLPKDVNIFRAGFEAAFKRLEEELFSKGLAGQTNMKALSVRINGLKRRFLG